jgi:hypothetical protein
MRIKPDGTLDYRPPAKTREQLDEKMGERILANVLRNHPELTREEAQKMLDHFL